MIAVYQVDGKIPNLSIMKIVGYYEKVKEPIEWYKGEIFNNTYDKIYASQIFSFSETPQLPKEKSFIGGTGIDFYNKLPKEIEDSIPSYSFYKNCNYHIGFSQKGCRFSCDFCCVPKKEGKPYLYNTIDEILINPNGGKNLMLLDNDFFSGNWKINLERIMELKLKVCFVQGLNIRIITSEQALLLSQCNYSNSKFTSKYLTFAWDRIKDEKRIFDGIALCKESGIQTKNMQFFVLVGYNSSPEEDYYRVTKLYEKGALPYVMPYNKFDTYQKRFARWVNHRAIFKSVKWKDYK